MKIEFDTEEIDHEQVVEIMNLFLRRFDFFIEDENREIEPVYCVLSREDINKDLSIRLITLRPLIPRPK
ncbi:MAG: hypothetical protein IMZ64_05145 [Bacteroidetes bacterium]|nr:hypothetical protein [Bacteroidota bacterium]